MNDATDWRLSLEDVEHEVRVEGAIRHVTGGAWASCRRPRRRSGARLRRAPC
jgi:hypothetical protein